MSTLPVAGRRSAAPSPRAVGVVPALLAEPQEDGSVRCNACAMRCLVRPGRTGICGVRENRDGIALLDRLRSRGGRRHRPDREEAALPRRSRGPRLLDRDGRLPVPLLVLPELGDRPGAAPGPRPARRAALPPSRVVDEALNARARAIAYTYVEPTVFLEYALDTAREAHAAGLLNVFVTDGYATPEAIDLLRPVLDAANVDLKSFDDAFYRKLCGARLAPVLDALRAYRAAGVWLEVTTLVIPGHNDDSGELRALAGWIASELGPETPWHVSRFFPAHRMHGRAADAPRDPAPGRRHRARGRAGPRLRRQRAAARDGGHRLRRVRARPPRAPRLPGLRPPGSGRVVPFAAGARSRAARSTTTGAGPADERHGRLVGDARPAPDGGRRVASTRRVPARSGRPLTSSCAGARSTFALSADLDPVGAGGHPGPARGARLLGSRGGDSVAASCERPARPGRAATRPTLRHDRPPRDEPRCGMARRRRRVGRRAVADAARRGRDRPRADRRGRGLGPPFAADARCHLGEHSLEVQLPFVRRLAPEAPDRRPLGRHGDRPAGDRGRRAARPAPRRPGGPAGAGRRPRDQLGHGALPAGWCRRAGDGDTPAVDHGPRSGRARRAEAATRREPGVSCGMCGIEPAVLGLAALRAMGAVPGVPLAAATSADAGGDPRRTVGYLAAPSSGLAAAACRARRAGPRPRAVPRSVAARGGRSVLLLVLRDLVQVRARVVVAGAPASSSRSPSASSGRARRARRGRRGRPGAPTCRPAGRAGARSCRRGKRRRARRTGRG